MYPVTIFKTRYQGVYEGGAWAAFPLHPEDIPIAATGDDISCAEWWDMQSALVPVGVGITPCIAYHDLERKSDG